MAHLDCTVESSIIDRTADENASEHARLAALRSCEIIGSARERRFDDLTMLAATVCSAPFALLSLADAQRLWFKSSFGIGATEAPRVGSFCEQAISTGAMFVVEDARRDPRFTQHPMVAGTPHVAFYAGAPITLAPGHTIGSLCVKDTRPRTLTPDQRLALELLAGQVGVLLEERRSRRVLERLTNAGAAADALLDCDDNTFSLVFESSPIGMALVAASGEWLRVNRALCEMVGYDADALLGRTFQSLTHPLDLALDLELRAQLMQGKISAYQREKRYLHKAGGTLPVKLTVSLISRAGTPPVFLAQVEDVSARRRGEDQVRHAREQLAGELLRPVEMVCRDIDRLAMMDLPQTAQAAAYDSRHSLQLVREQLRRLAGAS